MIPPDLWANLRTRSLLICVPNMTTMQPYSALAILFSTELAGCKLIKLADSIRLTSFIHRWKATRRGYNRARFRLESVFYCDMRASRSFLPMLKAWANFWKLVSWVVSIQLGKFLVPELQIVPSLCVPNFVSIRSLGEKRTRKRNKGDKKTALVAIEATSAFGRRPQ